MLLPNYDIDKIKFATDVQTIERAMDLYEGKKVTKFEEDLGGYSALVIGNELYHVFVSNRYFDRGRCTCYLGKRDVLCKHMVAVAVYALFRGQQLSSEEKTVVSEPECSYKIGVLDETQFSEVKKGITMAIRYVKSYNGPSRIWFQYQNSLSEGCSRLAKIISNLPVSEQAAQVLVDLLLRLDKKLSVGGVDDSDGRVGGFMQQTVLILIEYARHDPKCIQTFKKIAGHSTCFDWDGALMRILDEGFPDQEV